MNSKKYLPTDVVVHNGTHSQYKIERIPDYLPPGMIGIELQLLRTE